MKTQTTYILEATDIYSAYRGKEGCACGCNGKYYDADDDLKLNQIAKTINNNIGQVMIFKGCQNEVIFELAYGIKNERVIRAYINTDQLDAHVQAQLLAVAQ